MSKFFIDRPIFAWVISIVIMIVGAVAITQMPVEQYPSVAPTQISISATYPGATAQTLEESVLSVIEREMNGAEGMTYMETVSEANGTGSITISFEPGVDPDMAQVDVQNLLARATPRLPASVTQQGVLVRQSRSNFLMMVALTSTNPDHTAADLNDYAARNITDELTRLQGVGQAMQFGSEKAMRIWVDPALLEGYGLSMQQVAAAVAAQNAQVSGGTLGNTPIANDQLVFSAIVVKGQLETPEEFSSIILRGNADGSSVTLGDVARVEIGTQSYGFSALLNGKNIAGVGVQLSNNGNALATAKAVKDKLEELSPYFPEGMHYVIPYDTTKFISASIEGVVETLFHAILLVFLVMYLFLQNVRYTVIPTIVVPIALLGGFASLFFLGFSVNVLTMFAMVLVIGIVVDDAIIVVENVERLMAEEGLSPLQASRKAMDQIQSAIIGVTVVLISVFVPLAFFKGSTGNIYRQFSATMTTSIAFSAFLALTLTPALCATMLKPIKAKLPDSGKVEKKNPVTTFFDKFFSLFNKGFAATTKGYVAFLTFVLRFSKAMVVVYLSIVLLTGYLFTLLPTSFLPDEDQGVVIAMIQLPSGATADRTENVLAKFELYMSGRPDLVEGIESAKTMNAQSCEKLQTYARDNKNLLDGLLPLEMQSDCNALFQLFKGQPEVEHTMVVRGFSFSGQGQNTGISFVPLTDWHEREDSYFKEVRKAMSVRLGMSEPAPNRSAKGLAGRAMGGLSGVRDGFVYTMSPPPIPELGIASGFEIRLEDRGGHGHAALVEARNSLIAAAAQSEKLDGVRPDGMEDSEQTNLLIDREKAQTQGVTFDAINGTLGIAIGSSYINDYIAGGRTQRVIVQADAHARMQEKDLLKLTVMNNQGKLVPFSSFAKTEIIFQPTQTVRYNGYPAMKISGSAKEGFSTGDAMTEMERLAESLPNGFAIEWTGQSREEKLAGSQTLIVYGFAILAVFLCLAALYESWSIPFSVMLVVPLGVLGVVLAVWARGMENDVYFQIGLITVIGLSSKNAILIVEFAKDLQEAGMGVVEAAIEAAHLRFRPILMTSLAFLLGVTPLFMATGASSASQRAIGTGVIGGMISGTILALLFVPTFFVVIRSVFKGTPKDENGEPIVNQAPQVEAS